MTRTYAAAVNSYLSEPVIEMRTIGEITYSNTTMRLHTGVGSLMVGATHYDGVGNFGGMESIQEDPLTLTPTVRCYVAVDSRSLSEGMSETLFNKHVVLRRAWINNGTVVNTPEMWFDGKIGSVQLHRSDPERGTHYEILLQTRMDRRRSRRTYTTEDMMLTYSGDTFFNYLSQIQGQQSLWGQNATFFASGNPDQLVWLFNNVKWWVAGG